MRLARPERIGVAMAGADNPYRAPEAPGALLDDDVMPTVLKGTIALYAFYCLGEVVWMRLTSFRTFEMFTAVAALNLGYGAFMCFALTRRWPWARVVLMATTFLAALGGALLVARRGAWHVNWPAMLTYSLRIAVGGPMFHPAIGRWFEKRRA